MSEPDLLFALRALYLDTADVTSLVDTRVFGGELPGTETSQMPRAAIVLARAGGLEVFGQGYQTFTDRRVDVRCYGATPAAADAVWRAQAPVMKHLKRQVREGMVLHWARSAGGPVAFRDPDGDWPVVVGSWQVLHALDEVDA